MNSAIDATTFEYEIFIAIRSNTTPPLRMRRWAAE
jgi:hypothetical protein